MFPGLGQIDITTYQPIDERDYLQHKTLQNVLVISGMPEKVRGFI